MIKLREVSVFKKDKLVLNNLNIDFKGKVVIVGLNNSGKTTILEALCGKAKIETGVIKLDENFVREFQLDENNSGFMYIPKNHYIFLENLKVNDIRKYFLKGKAMNTVLLDEWEINQGIKFKKLTYIQKLLLFINIGLETGKKIFVLDEPCFNLDISEKLIFQKIIDTYLTDNLVIISSNDPYDYVFQKFDRMLFIHNKTLQDENPY